MIISIVNVDKNLGIGKDNDLLFHLPSDMKFFKESTMNHVVAMGKNTLNSLPNGKPLKGRINIVLSHNPSEGVVNASSLGEFVFIIKEYSKKDDVFIIGGASIYKDTIDIVDEVWMTKVDEDGKAAAFFPNIDDKFVCYEQSEPINENGVTFVFTKWKRI